MRLLRSALDKLHDDGVRGLVAAIRSSGHREIHLSLHNLLLKLPPDWIMRSVRFRSTVFPWRYTDADPFKIIYADPSTITHYSELTRPIRWGRVIGGEWDTDYRQFTQREIVLGVYELIEHDDEERLRSAIADRLKRTHRDVWGYESVEKVDDRLQDVKGLIDSIESNGYRRQTELETAENHWRGTHYYPDRLNEVTVNIGRDGTFYYVYCGQHRLAIAQALDIERIPVLVSARHEGWQQIRDSIRMAESLDEVPASARQHINHPDVQDLDFVENIGTGGSSVL